MNEDSAASVCDLARPAPPLRGGREFIIIEERFARPPPPPSVFDRFESACGFCEDRCE